MQVIGHENIPADVPFGCAAPRGDQLFLDFRTREQWTAAPNADSQENDNGSIGHLDGRVMRRVVTRGGKSGGFCRQAEFDGRIVILEIHNRNRHKSTGPVLGAVRL